MDCGRLFIGSYSSDCPDQPHTRHETAGWLVGDRYQPYDLSNQERRESSGTVRYLSSPGMCGPLGCGPEGICVSLSWRYFWSGWILPIRASAAGDGCSRDKGNEWPSDGEISDLPSRRAQ